MKKQVLTVATAVALMFSTTTFLSGPALSHDHHHILDKIRDAFEKIGHGIKSVAEHVGKILDFVKENKEGISAAIEMAGESAASISKDPKNKANIKDLTAKAKDAVHKIAEKYKAEAAELPKDAKDPAEAAKVVKAHEDLARKTVVEMDNVKEDFREELAKDEKAAPAASHQ